MSIRNLVEGSLGKETGSIHNEVNKERSLIFITVDCVPKKQAKLRDQAVDSSTQK